MPAPTEAFLARRGDEAIALPYGEELERSEARHGQADTVASFWRHTTGTRGLLLLAFLLIVAACTASSPSTDNEAVEPAILVATPQPTGEAQPTPVPEGVVTNQYDLEVSSCFNRYEIYSEVLDSTTEQTTVVDCRRPHDGEVYASYFHPAVAGAPYPGSADMELWGNQNCYGAFADFVGTDFELSALEVGTIRPTEETWTGEGLHREVTCYVFVAGAQLEGPMGGSGI